MNCLQTIKQLEGIKEFEPVLLEKALIDEDGMNKDIEALDIAIDILQTLQKLAIEDNKS